MNSIEKAKVLVIGAGPAGVGVATGLARRGINPVVLIDRNESVGGVPSLYKPRPGGVPTFVLWSQGRLVSGDQMATHLTDKLQDSKVEMCLETQVIEISADERKLTLVNPSRGRFQVSADAVVLACGARERTPVERGWIFGSRPSGLLFTKNLLELIDQCKVRVALRPVILGSDLIAYSAAAKLKSIGGSEAVMVDRPSLPDCSLPARLYFRRWANPQYQGGAKVVTVAGTRSVSAVAPANGTKIRGDMLMVCGDLVPNTELALMGNLRVDMASRRVAVGSDYQLSKSGWFAAGNILGSYHGAEWCYF
ncbi:MAG: FAD-dependent oxidoreductase, partial [Acidobacteriota bacterium]|nr:FAD-dependent oxidoreductase [Acidobacteriota bacterium]